MQDYTLLQVRLTPLQRKYLDIVLNRARERSPLFPPSQSDVIRKLIIDDASACPQCGGQTSGDPSRPGVHFCAKCGELVLFRDNGK